MKTIELYFRDLNQEAQAHIKKTFDTTEDNENWETVPLTILERDNEHEQSHAIRSSEWRQFAQHMESYIRDRTIEKYSLHGSTFDLMTFTDAMTCVWNVLKYTLRIMNGRAKEHDIEKIAHYAQMYWTKQCQTVPQTQVSELPF